MTSTELSKCLMMIDNLIMKPIKEAQWIVFCQQLIPPGTQTYFSYP